MAGLDARAVELHRHDHIRQVLHVAVDGPMPRLQGLLEIDQNLALVLLGVIAVAEVFIAVDR